MLTQTLAEKKAEQFLDLCGGKVRDTLGKIFKYSDSTHAGGYETWQWKRHMYFYPSHPFAPE